MDMASFGIKKETIIVFCQKWKISEFSFFGSILREDFHSKSDIDVLVTFQPQTKYSVLDLGEMQMELSELFGKPVDLVEKSSLVNPFRRKDILQTAEVVYAT